MRDYKQKMQRYRLEKFRYKELRLFCMYAKREDKQNIIALMRYTVPDVLGGYILDHLMNGKSIAKLEVDGMPCSLDTFRVYRAKFLYYLDKELKEHEKTD